MKLSSLTESDILCNLTRSHLRLKIAAFGVAVSSELDSLAKHLIGLYGDFDLLPSSSFVDFNISLNSPSLLRRHIKSQVQFSFDGYLPFAPLPIVQVGALFEWGLNWCIANSAHQYLIIHAAVIEKNGVSFVMPGVPGIGKSTLCAALVCDGWRLLSDEMALISVNNGLLYPVTRPVSLKNQSISIIQNQFPDAVFGPSVKDTAKGTIAHMRPPVDSVEQSHLSVKPAIIVFPQYKAEAKADLLELNRAEAFMKVARNSFNYNVLGSVGFDLLANTVEASQCYEFQYHSLNDAFRIFNQLSLG